MRPSGFVCLATLAASLLGGGPALSQPAAPSGGKYALLVGVKAYESGAFSPLAYPENDVEQLAEVLAQRSHGSFEVTLLTNTRGQRDRAAQPTVSNIRAQLKRLTARRRA